MASTPSATIHEHLNAVNQADREQLLATATYPLFQGMEDGEKRWYQTVDENLEVYAALQVRLELVSEDILATSGDVVLFSLIGQFFDKNEKPASASTCCGLSTASRTIGRSAGGNSSERSESPRVPHQPAV